MSGVPGRRADEPGIRSAPDRRQVLSSSAAGIITLVLPSASASATNVQPLASPAELTFSNVTRDGFTVSWGSS